MKISRLQRILQLVTILQSGRSCSATELAQWLGVTRRTVFRDLQLLNDAGVPCYHDPERGGYQMAESFFLPPLNLTLSEALALLLTAHHPSTVGGVGLQRSARQAALKIESVLPHHVQAACGSLLRSMSLRHAAQTPRDGCEEGFNLLQVAVQQRRKVNLCYESFAEQDEIRTTLSPYHLHFAQRAWYVIGHSSGHDAVRIFKLKRIKNLELMKRKYLLDRPFDVEAFLGKAWSLIPEGREYRVRLRFAPMVARNVAEVLWHPTQKLAWQPGGGLMFEAVVDGLREIVWWILGYGDQVEVLAPAALRERVACVARRMAERYASSTPEGEHDAGGHSTRS